MEYLKSKIQFFMDIVGLYFFEIKNWFYKIINKKNDEELFKDSFREFYKESYDLDDNELKERGRNSLKSLKGIIEIEKQDAKQSVTIKTVLSKIRKNTSKVIDSIFHMQNSIIAASILILISCSLFLMYSSLQDESLFLGNAKFLSGRQNDCASEETRSFVIELRSLLDSLHHNDSISGCSMLEIIPRDSTNGQEIKSARGEYLEIRTIPRDSMNGQEIKLARGNDIDTGEIIY